MSETKRRKRSSASANEIGFDGNVILSPVKSKKGIPRDYSKSGLEGDLKEVKIKAVDDLNEDSFDPDTSEIWLIQCPANVDLRDLTEGKKLCLDGTTSLEGSNKRRLESVSIPKSNGAAESIVALIPSPNGGNQLVTAPLRGHILIRESIQELPAPKLLPNPKPHHTLPAAVKVRHPLYGTDIPRSSVRTSKKQGKGDKSRSRKSRHSLPEESNEIINPEVSEVIEKDAKTRKKSKHNGVVVKLEQEDQAVAPKKKRRRD